VSSTANFTVTFPDNYTTISNVTCVSVSVMGISVSNFSCNISGNTIIVSNAFTSLSNLGVTNVSLVVGNVLNPSPAIYTGTFSGSIGIDVAVPRSTGMQLTPGTILNKFRLFQQLHSSFFTKHSLQQYKHNEHRISPYKQSNIKQFNTNFIPQKLLE
jgi:hypothetical protein